MATVARKRGSKSKNKKYQFYQSAFSGENAPAIRPSGRNRLVLNRVERACSLPAVDHLQDLRLRGIIPNAIDDHFEPVASFGRAHRCRFIVLILFFHFAPPFSLSMKEAREFSLLPWVVVARCAKR